MLKKIIKFGITGGLGTITNLLLFFRIIASIICGRFGLKTKTFPCLLNYGGNLFWVLL